MNINHEMKMIRHQTPGKYICMWQNIQIYFFQKEKVIVLGKENFLSVITLVVSMIQLILFKYQSLKF